MRTRRLPPKQCITQHHLPDLAGRTIIRAFQEMVPPPPGSELGHLPHTIILVFDDGARLEIDGAADAGGAVGAVWRFVG